MKEKMPEPGTVPTLLITGGRGFIGTHVLEALDSWPGGIHGVSRSEEIETSNSEIHWPKMQWHCCDLLNSSETTELVASIRPTHLLHLAWITTPQQFWNSPDNQLWVDSTVHLCQEFLRSRGRRMVVSGSCAEYDGSSGVCSEFSTPLEPESLYGKSKVQCWNRLTTLAQQHDAELAWGRVFFPYGPGEHADKLIPSLTLKLLRGHPARCNCGTLQRDYIHVSDVARAFVLLLQSELTGPVNIGSGTASALGDLARGIGKALDMEDKIQVDSSPSSTPLLVADISRLTSELGFTPQVSLCDGVERSVRWLQSRVTI